MLDCVSVSNMRLSDSNTIKSGISGLELIHRAAMAVYNTVKWSGRIAIFVGGGNNGADGFALAGILKENNYEWYKNAVYGYRSQFALPENLVDEEESVVSVVK